MTKRLAWCKLYESWYTTRSHVELGGVALNIGPRLMSLANSSRTVTPDVRGDVRGPSGAPLSLAAIAREVRFSEAETAEALRQLVACGTLIQKDDGCWSFPNFESWQETRDAARMRAHRERTNTVTVTRTVTGVVTPVSVLSSSSDLSEGVQGEIEPQPPPAAVAAEWNAMARRTGQPQIEDLGPDRKRAIAARVRESAERKSIDWWRGYFARIERSAFLSGRAGDWRGCSFDFAIGPKNMRKILEGNYEDKTEAQRPAAPKPQTPPSASIDELPPLPASYGRSTGQLVLAHPKKPLRMAARDSLTGDLFGEREEAEA